MQRIGIVPQLDAGVRKASAHTGETAVKIVNGFRESFEASDVAAAAREKTVAPPAPPLVAAATKQVAVVGVQTSPEPTGSAQPLLAPAGAVIRPAPATVLAAAEPSSAKGLFTKAEGVRSTAPGESALPPKIDANTEEGVPVTAGLQPEIALPTVLAVTPPLSSATPGEVMSGAARGQGAGSRSAITASPAKAVPNSSSAKVDGGSLPMQAGDAAAPVRGEDHLTPPAHSHEEQPANTAEGAAPAVSGTTHLLPSLNLASPIPGQSSSDAAMPIEKPITAPLASSHPGDLGHQDLPASHATLIATPDVLEVGLNNSVHGWVKVRAELDSTGLVAAMVIGRNGSSAVALGRELPALTAYLADQSVTVGSLSVKQTEATAMQPDLSGSGGANQQQRDDLRQTSTRSVSAEEADAAFDHDGDAVAVTLATFGFATAGGGGWLNVLA